jgi:integrase
MLQARKRRGGRPDTQRRKPWFVQYREPDGRQKSPGFATKAAADAWIREHAGPIHARKQLVPLVPSDSTVTAYGAHWLTAMRRSVKPRTLECYANQLALYLGPRLGDRRVVDLTRPELRAFVIGCREAGASGRPLKAGSIYAIYATLRAMLNAAIEDGLRGDNPAARLGKKLHLHPTKRGRQALIRRRALDREQTAQLLEFIRTQAPTWYPLVLLLARTGLRLGEAQMLRLDDYNADAATLRIERAWDSKHGREETPKHGARTIDVSPELAAILDAHTAALRKVVGLDGTPVVPWLLPSQAGTMLEGRNIRRGLALLAAQAGLRRPLTPHDLRHTFGSQLIAAGANPVYVQRQMGHASLQTTVDLYGSWLPLEAGGAVAVLDSTRTGNDAGGGTVVVRGGTEHRRRVRT